MSVGTSLRIKRGELVGAHCDDGALHRHHLNMRVFVYGNAVLAARFPRVTVDFHAAIALSGDRVGDYALAAYHRIDIAEAVSALAVEILQRQWAHKEQT